MRIFGFGSTVARFSEARIANRERRGADYDYEHEHEHDKRGEAGFTLLEVLIAMAILATALFIIMDLHYSALGLYDASRQETIERNLMRQALGMAEADLMAGNASGSGDFGKRFPEYTYSYNSSAVGEDPSIGMYDVLVTVEGPEEKREMHMFVYYMGGSQYSDEPGFNEGRAGGSGGSSSRSRTKPGSVFGDKR